MSNEERAEKRAIVDAGTDGAAEAADKLFVCYRLDGKLDSAIIYARKGVEIGLRKQDSKIWLEAYHQLAVSHLDTPNLDSARFYFNLLLDKTVKAEEDHEVKIRAIAYMYFGAMYLEHSLGYEEAFSYFNRAKETSKKINLTFVYVRSTIAQTQILIPRKRYDEIDELLTEAYEYVEQNDPKNVLSLINLQKEKALCLAASTDTKKREEGMDLMLEVYELSEKHKKYKTRGFIFIDIALNYAANIPEKELLRMAEDNLSFAKDKMSGLAKGGLYQAYGHVLLHTRQYRKAIPYLVESKENLSGAQHMTNYLSVCEDLIRCYERTNQLDKIIPEFQDYKVFRDSLEATVYSDKLLELEEKYKTEKKENENIQLQAQNSLIQSRFRYSSIIGSLLLGLLVAGFYFFQKLRKTKLQLEDLNQDKNKLFAILAHDLRSPIASLSNLSQKVKFLTEEGRLNELDAFAQMTDAKLSALNDNLNNILLWAIKESNLVAVKREKVSLYDEVNKINQLYADDIKQKDIIIQNKLSSSDSVHTDLKVLQTVLRNLINNAIKFSFPGGVIEFAVEKEQASLDLRIIDNGIGLEDADHDQKGSSAALRKKAQGTGIGLKICKELAAKVNLDLRLVSNPEGGTIGIIRFMNAA